MSGITQVRNVARCGCALSLSIGCIDCCVVRACVFGVVHPGSIARM
ncbi:hypothetical protein [Lysobacter gummosus]